MRFAIILRNFPHFSLDKTGLVLYTVICYGRLAQLVELPLDVRKVGDSSSSASTRKKALSFDKAFFNEINLFRDL